MKIQHTPSPWKHDETWGLIKYGKTEICALHSGNEANAHLIAAAPDLLEALKELVDLNIARNMNKAKAAIAKAKGEA